MEGHNLQSYIDIYHKKTVLLWKTQNSEKHAVYICIPRVFAYVIRYTLKFSVYLIAYLLWVSLT